MTYVERLREALGAAMESDRRVVVLGEDILDPYGGAFKATRGLSTRFPDRVLTTPICEQTIAGLAVGLALRGMRPVAELMFGDFIALAADQIINHAAKFHAMYNGRVDVPLVIRTPMGGGRGYGPTHSQSLESLFLGVPHLRIVAPSLFHDPGALLAAAVADPGPVLFIEHKLLYPLRLPGEGRAWRCLPSEGGDFPSVRLANYDGDERPDATLITYGGVSRFLPPLFEWCAREEIRLLAHVVADLNADVDPALIESAAASGRVVVVEEGGASFGWGAEISSRIYDALHGTLRSPVRRVGALPGVIPASRHLEDRVLVSEATIISAILEILQ
jgi:pyruvate/2-oxoglutarate/acetoin dehydrogenase E1 component